MSAFNQRSDSAANRLRGDINVRQGTNLRSTPVAVGPDGQPAAPPPPPGSYARQAYDRMQQGQPTQQQILGDQPPAGTPEQQSDGSVAPPLTTGQPEAATPEGSPQPPAASENANRRIQDLIAQLRAKDGQIAEMASRNTEFDEVRRQLAALQQERDRFLESGLDDLDPETRASVLAKAQFQQMLAENNRVLMEALQPRLASLQESTNQSEMDRLAKRYPGFDMQIHPQLIDQLRAKVPALTMEMAFKAVAEGDEATPRDVAQHVAVPPVVPANHGSQLPRYMPEPQSDPTDELRNFQRRANELVRSSNPAEQREGQRMMSEAIAQRLSGSSYAGKPGVFGG